MEKELVTHRIDLGRGFVPRERWPAGPWDAEPDRVEWTGGGLCKDGARFAFLLKRNGMGVWCGYVGVPPGHPAHGLDYDDPALEDIEVHWGLTFAGECQKDERMPEPSRICRRPAPGEPDDLWWLGFDCGHGFDYSPAMAAMSPTGLYQDRLGEPFGMTYRGLQYAREQTISLGVQLSELSKRGGVGAPTAPNPG